MRYIAIEGVIGVGKTALAEIIAAEWGAKCILEEVGENPFLENFYSDIRNYALKTQLYFLLARHTQQQRIKQMDIFVEKIVADYFFEKDRIFAYLTLTEPELILYEKIYELLSREVTKPDLIVFLQAKLETILERIKKRGRPFEQNIQPQYLEALAASYSRFFLHYDASPILIVNTDDIDPINRKEDFNNLFRAIMSHTEGRKFYSPR